jgi:hypothetical protein
MGKFKYRDKPVCEKAMQVGKVEVREADEGYHA